MMIIAVIFVVIEKGLSSKRNGGRWREWRRVTMFGPQGKKLFYPVIWM